MAAGGTAAARVHDRLASLAVPEAAYALYVASRARPQDPSVQLAFVRPGPKSQADAQRIEQVFGDLAGAPLDTKAVQHRTARQYGLDRYESVDAGSALHDRVNSPQELFTLGGFLDISGLPPNALAGSNTASPARFPTAGSVAVAPVFSCSRRTSGFHSRRATSGSGATTWNWTGS